MSHPQDPSNCPACTCSLQVPDRPQTPVLPAPRGCMAATLLMPTSLPVVPSHPHHPVTSRPGGRSPSPRPSTHASSPPTPPQTWRGDLQKSLRPAKNATAAVPAPPCSCCGETDHWPCLRGLPQRPHDGCPLRLTCDAPPPPGHPAPRHRPAGGAAGPCHTRASAAAPVRPSSAAGAPGLPVLAPRAAPHGGAPRPRRWAAAGGRRGPGTELSRGRQKKRRKQAIGLPSGSPRDL